MVVSRRRRSRDAGSSAAAASGGSPLAAAALLGARRLGRCGSERCAGCLRAPGGSRERPASRPARCCGRRRRRGSGGAAPLGRPALGGPARSAAVSSTQSGACKTSSARACARSSRARSSRSRDQRREVFAPLLEVPVLVAARAGRAEQHDIARRGGRGGVRDGGLEVAAGPRTAWPSAPPRRAAAEGLAQRRAPRRRSAGPP